MMDGMDIMFYGTEPVGVVGAAATFATDGRRHRTVVATPGLRFDGPVGERFVLRQMNLARYQLNPVVLFEHGGDARLGNRPVGETTDIRFDAEGRLVAEFILHQGDPEVEHVARMWQTGQVKGASIGVRVNEDGEFELYEWSIVALPRDGMALREYSLQTGDGTMVMTDTTADAPAPAGEAAPDETTRISTMVREAVQEAMAAWQASASAPAAPAPAPAPPTVPPGAPPTPGPTGLPMSAEWEAANSKILEEVYRGVAREAAGQKHEATLLKARGLLPSGYDPTGKTEHEVLVASVGAEVDRAEERSDEYLRGALDQIWRRREAAAIGLGGQGGDAKDAVLGAWIYRQPSVKMADLYAIRREARW